MRIFTLLSLAIAFIFSISNLNAQNLIVGDNGTILSSDNGGATWATKDVTGLSGDLRAIGVVDANTIFLGGNAGVYKSTDALGTATNVYSDKVWAVNQIQTYNSGTNIRIAGRRDRNPAIKSDDGGTSWNTTDNGNRDQTYKSLVKANGNLFMTEGIEIKRCDLNYGSDKIQFSYADKAFNGIYNTGSVVFIVGVGGKAYKSTDDGTTWENLNDGSGNDIPATTKTLNDVRVSPNGNNVVIVGDDGYAAYSSDGGNTWRSATNDADSDDIQHIEFADDNTVYLTFYGSSDSEQGIFKSTNGGANFTRIDWSADFNVHSSQTETYQTSFIDADNGWCLIGDRSWQILKTTDGFASYTTATVPYTDRGYLSIHAFDMNTAIITGTTGYSRAEVYLTTDGGANWEKVISKTEDPTGGSSRKNNFYFVDNNTGYYCDSKGYIATTTDGGNNWTHQRLDGENWDIKDIHNGWVCGAGFKVYKTTDYQNYERKYILDDNYGGPQKLFAVSDNNILAVGLSGMVLKTTDNGNTWTAIATNNDFTEDLKNLYFTDENTGWVIGKNGFIAYTTDAGTSWTEQTTNTTETLNGIYAYDANNVVIVGDNGTILKTTDAGTKWTKINSSTGADLYEVVYTDNTNAMTIPDISVATPSTLEYCPESTLDDIVYTVTGAYDATNEFVLEISDKDGNWSTVTELATQAGTGSGSFTSITVPETLPVGSAYKIRVSGTKPAVYAEVDAMIGRLDVPDAGNNLAMEYCTGNEVVITPVVDGGAFTSNESFGPISGNTLSFTTAGTYNVTYTVTVECTAESVKNITVKQTPDATFSGLAAAYCSGETATMTPVTAGGTFTPNAIGTISGNDFTFTNAGTYNVTYAVAVEGCPSETVQKVEVKQTPDATFSGLVIETCTGTEATLTVTTEGGTFSPASIGTITDNTLSFTNAGTYDITYSITENGCTATETENITVKQSPAKPAITADDVAKTLEATIEGASYKWILNETTTTTLTGKTVTPTETGNYQVVVTDDNGCDSEASDVVSFTLSIRALNKLTDVQFYPNPTNDIINIKTGANISTVTVYNLLGKKLKTVDNLNVQNYQMNLKSFGQGIYFVEISTNKGTAVQKVIVK